MTSPLRVLVVDDSAVVRQALSQILGHAGMRVVTANDPIIAIDKMRREPPDVVVLDIEMPRMDGLTFLQKIMADRPLPVVVCSGLAGPGTEVALHALEEGAVDVVTKPRLGVKGFLEDSARRLVNVVRAAAEARVRPRSARLPVVPRLGADAVVPRRAPVIRETTHKVVVVGASTGGTEALRELLEAMPPDAPGIAIVQHMPEVFTAQFAKRLDQICRIEVKEAQTNAVGVILTGMGDDGAEGLAELRRAGARTIAQDEATCVVFGMPKEAIAAGGVEEVLPLPRIAAQVLKWAR